jgi:hypothetical protein
MGKVKLAVMHGISESVLWWAKFSSATRIIPLYQPLTDVGLDRKGSNERMHERLDAIRHHLPPGPLTGMDIGCNIGFYVFEFVKDGHKMIAVEADWNYFSILFAARRRLRRESDIIPISFYFTPDTISALPIADFTIFMSVFHHWCREFGTGPATDMLLTILRRSRKALFFEPPFWRETKAKNQKALPDYGAEDSVAWWRDFFQSHGCRRVEVIYRNWRSLMLIEPPAQQTF